jgi:O-antigen/teichoic acid export membrane protein
MKLRFIADMKIESIKDLVSGRLKRIAMGVMSQGYAQFVTIFTQIMTVPFLLASWGAEKYGAWVLLSTIPSYISMADLGFVQIAANDMTMKVSRGDKEGANLVFQTATAMVLCISVFVLAVFGGIAFFLPITDIFHINSVTKPEASWTVFILAIQVLLSIVFGLFGAGLRATGLFSLMVSINSTARLLDGIALVVVALLHGSFVGVALITITTRTLITSGTAAMLLAREPWLKLGIGSANLTQVRKMLLPSLSYMSYTLSYALSIQGMTLITGAMLGPVAAAITSTVRTLTRMGVMASNMFNHVLEPEYAQVYGQGRRDSMLALYKRHIRLLCAIAGVYTVATVVCGQEILKIWTHGRIHPTFLFMALMTFSVTFEMLWSMFQTPFVATNRHKFFALWYIAFSVLGVVIASSLISLTGIAAIGWGTALSNFAFLLLSLYKISRIELLPESVEHKGHMEQGAPKLKSLSAHIRN